MNKACTAIFLIALFSLSCGGSSDYNPNVPTDSPPIVSRAEPSAGKAGDVISIFGLGYSIAYPEDIVVVGGAATSATSYRLLDNPTANEIEAITFIVPEDAEIGEGPIYVQVDGNSSNVDVSFTVLP